jgi:hypothetical protein
VDSGASQHLYCGNPQNLTNMGPAETIFITVANGAVLTSSQSGDFLFVTSGHIGILKNVYYVPQLEHNLLSIGQLTAAGYKISFAHNTCVISGQADKEFRAKRSNGIYVLKMCPRPYNSAKLAFNDSFSSDKHQGTMSWTELHKATGHTAFSTLDKAVKNGIYNGIKVDINSSREQCETCEIMKMTQKECSKIL